MSPTESRWLTDNFAPVTEEVTATDLTVTGTIPEDLVGRYLRNGPNPIGAVDPSTYHWFTGTGMVHGVRLRDGKAEWYRNRWVRSPEVAEALGEEAPPSPYGDDVRIFASNTNVIGHAGTTLAIVEAGAPPIELTYDLDTVGPTDFQGTLEHPFSAHPKRDPITGELHVVTYFWAWGEKLRYLIVGTDGKVRHSVDVPVPGSPMVHDTAITETYAVLYDLPCTFDLEAAMAGASLPYRWNPDYGARVGLIPREGQAEDVRWFEVEPCYVFHPLNAYDTPDGKVVLDHVRWPRIFDTDHTGPSEGPTRLERWTIDPAADKVIEETLDDRAQEFPRHDERILGRRHRYAYSAALDFGTGFGHGAAIKYDLASGRTEVRDFGPGRATGEMVFVPRSADALEDDGWLISFVHDRASDRSDLVILHAQDFGGDPVAVVHLPQRVPFGFHGNWVPDTA
ncbi:MAG TPA: carotenoid oxygenase family protein [Acidimicrobiia bacterium]|nr:carotenoid oxygenase family protein [Acidimicrobiia bacterium]